MAGTLEAGVLPETSNPDLLTSSLDMEPPSSAQEPMDLDVPLDTPKMSPEFQEDEDESAAAMEVDEQPPPLLSKINNTQSEGDVTDETSTSPSKDISAPLSISHDEPATTGDPPSPGKSPISSQSSASSTATPSNKHLPDNARPDPAEEVVDTVAPVPRPSPADTDKTDQEKCGECSNDFNDLQSYMTHNCSGSSGRTEEGSEPSNNNPPIPKKMKMEGCSSSSGKSPQQEQEEQRLSDAESFDGKIVYNPDGSAYIIEGESDLSETESLLDVPQQEGSIVDHKGKVVSSTVAAFPQIANAFYIQRNPQAFYNSFYMFPPEQRSRTEAPIMHSFKVYDLRTKKGKANGCDDVEDKENEAKKDAKLGSLSSDISTVPTKPILMCFICKLSFGYAKSFVAHAIGEHGMSLLEEERSLMSRKNASAIIQGLGKEKDPLLSFLEPSQPPQSGPSSSSAAAANSSSSSAQSLPQQGIFPPAMFNNSGVSSSGNTSVNFVHGNAAKVSAVQKEQGSTSASAQGDGDREGEAGRPRPSNGSPEASDPHRSLPQGANMAAGGSGKTENDFMNNKSLLSSRGAGDSPDDSMDDDSRVSFTKASRDEEMTSKSPRAVTSPAGLYNANSVPSSSPGSDTGRGGTPGSSGADRLMNTSGSSGGSGAGMPRLTSTPTTTTESQPHTGDNPSLTLSPPGGASQHVQGIVIRAGCEDHPQGNITGLECPKCDMIMGSSRSLGGHMTMMHSRNSCKTLKCPKCNWHYKYQETLEIHMKEKHPENDTQCIYCITNQAHPRLARGEVYTCGYKPYRCEVCNYSTTTKGNLSIHMQSDKHINNMQELQNGTQEIKMAPAPSPISQQPQPQQQQQQQQQQQVPDNKNKNKPKPTWRCDVCNYETNVARNLRIHMTSEKHTHNMMVLQQNVKHMQRDMQFQLNQMAMLGQDPNQQGLPGLIPPGLPGMPPFFDQAAMFMQLPPQAMSGEVPVDLTKQENGVPGKSPLDVKNNNTEPNKLFQCAVCNLYSTDSLESLHQHMQRDRSKGNDQDNISVVGGTYMCNLCQYKTNLKANFQLHCKTDKHLQRLQLVNHIREGGHSNEWRLKYMNVSNPVQVRCNACDYYTNSIHKLQLHTTNPRHEGNAKLFHHLQACETKVSAEAKYYHCSLCNYSTKAKLSLIQHVRSMKHMRSESLRLMQLKDQGKESDYTPENIFSVRELKDNEVINFDEGDGDSANESSKTPDGENSMEFKPDPGFRDALMADSKHAMGGMSMGQQQQVHACPFCNYTCVNPVQMQGHIQSQHAQLPATGRALHCPLCQEKCGEKIQLEKHLFAVHNVTAEGMQRLLMLVDQPSWPSPPPATPTKSPAPSTSPAAATGATTPSPRPASTSAPREEEPSQDASDLQAEVLENQALFKLAEEASMDGVELSDKDGSDEHYRCQTCAKTFLNIDALYAHQNELGHLELKQTPRGPGYLCWKKGCNQYFKTAHTLQVHFREIHAKRQQVSVSERHVYKYRCNQCSLAFKTLDKLQLHSYYHIIRAATKCNVCGRNFRSIAAMRKHVESSHLDSMSPAELEEYQNSIASVASLGTLGVPGSENLTIAQLAEANREVLKQESLAKAMACDDTKEESAPATVVKSEAGEGTKDEQGSNSFAVKDENSEDYKDQQFFEDYINSQAIAENSYSDPARKYKCHRCKVAFTKQSYLSAHNKTLMHRKGDKLSYPMEKYLDPNRPYKCDVCKESFTQKNILLVHYNSVSHLHKLKQLTQQQQQQQHEARQELEASQGSGQTSPREGTVAHTSASSPSPTKVNNHAGNSSTSGRPSTPGSSPASGSPDSDKKPYKCNICKVSYSQGSTLDIHMRSVLHQTRASKLQELARTGQIDLSLPLIEQPDMAKTQEQHMKMMAEQMKLLSPERHQAVVDSPQSLGMPPPESPVMPPLTPLQAGSLTPTTPKLSSSTSSNRQQEREGERQSSSSQALYPCTRCNSLFNSQDALIQHQQIHCFTQPGATRGMPRFKPHVQKNLLENIGFECVMQFNEYHQRNKKKESQSEDKQGDASDNKDGKKEGGVEVKQEPMDVDEKRENEAEDDEAEKENKAASDMPEINKCQCRKCGKEFSSIWVLKAHQEEVHREIVPFDYVEQFSEQFREQYEKKQLPPPSVEPVVNATATENTAAEAREQEQYKGQIPTSLADDKTLSMTGDLAMDLALAQQTAQMMQMPMFNMMPMHLPGMPGMGQMGMMPPLMSMMMPPGLEFCAGGMPGMPMMDPAFMLAQQQQQAAAMAAAQQQKRARTRINDEQLKILRLYFDINNSPSEEQILEMSDKSGLPPKVIKHWFRNTLFKERQRNKDSPYNFSVPPSTTLNLEEYEKTGKVNNADGEPVNEKSPETPRKTPPTSLSVVPNTQRIVEREKEIKMEREEIHDSIDRESVASIGDSFVSSTCSTPAPHTPAPTSLSGLTPSSLAMAHQAAAAAASPAVSYNELSAALSSMVPTSLHSMVSSPPSLQNTQSSSNMYSQSGSTPPSGHIPGKRANRTRFTDYQIKVLQEYFEQNAYPKDDDLEKLSKMLGLSPRVIVVWFQNARQKARKNYENQPPVEVSEDGNRFTRTPGLNYQCKKCFTVFQRYYELIKHQRTHCYKDDEKSVNLSSLTNSMRSSSSKATEDSCSSSDEVMRTQSHTPHKESTPHTSPKGGSTTGSSTSSMEYPCEKCSLVFPSLELWKEHQNVHQMNPALYSPFPTGSAFGMLQNIAHQQQGGGGATPVSTGSSGGMSMNQHGHQTVEDMSSSSNKRSRIEMDEDDLRDDQPRDKRMRTTILPEQLDYLYQKYQIDCNPSRKQLETIAVEIGLKKRVVQVWFQNTRARERKGQFRAHQQLIHKRCPFCRALFRAKSALESHLATKHPDEMAKGDLNIDNIPDEAHDSMSSQPSNSTSPGNPGLDMAKLLNNPYNVPSPFGMGMMPPGMPGSSNSLQSNMNRLYEDSLKKYLDELSHASHPGSSKPPASSRPESGQTSSGGQPTRIKQEPDDGPLDLSKPIKVNADNMNRLADHHASTDMSDNRGEDIMHRRFSIDDSRSETHSESTENNDDFSINESNPPSPNSAMSGHSKQAQQLPSSGLTPPPGQGPTPPKRFRTQMTSLQIKVMKSLFHDYKTPTMAECEMLGRSIGLPKRVVQVWFQNARAKEKKAKLSYGNSYGSDVEFSRPPEECKICNFKYSHKYTVQDHIFTKKHIDNVKASIQSEKEGEQDAMNTSALARQAEGGAGKGANPGSDPAMMSHPHLAQLHAMGLQAMAMPGPMAALNPSVKVSSTPGEKKDASDGPRSVAVKQEPTARRSSESKAKESPAPPTSAAQMLSPFGAMQMPGAIDMGLAAQAGMLPFLYPGMSGYMPGMPGMPPMMPPGMMPGPEMFMYDPATFGTPLTLLQIPPQAIQDVQSKAGEEGVTRTRYTQDCRSPGELATLISSENRALIRETNIDVGYICKKCQMVYPGREACVSHQQMLCYQGKDLSSAKSILKLEQTQYDCTACNSKLNTLSEVKSHCSGDRHKQKAGRRSSDD